MLQKPAILIVLSNAHAAAGATGKLQVESFKTLDLAMKRINEIKPSLNIQPRKEYDPEDSNADQTGYVWVISFSPHKDADPLYLCTDGLFR